ncbi:MAG: prepilin-type N-terminal cleavage/methylation domain-containing protein [Candidatus Omnitrophota bacterium]
MSAKKGFTLVEVIIAIILSAIALFGIETLIVAAFKDWKTGKEIVASQRDLDVASYKIKGILEEANADTVYAVRNGAVRELGVSGTAIIASNTGWSKEFYLASGNRLTYYDKYPPNVSETIINTCSLLEFTNVDTRTVRVKVEVLVPNNFNPISNIFLVYLRNAGGG